MKRRLFNLATAFSLTMLLAIAVLWARSYWSCDHLSWEGTGGMFWTSDAPSRLMITALVDNRSAVPASTLGWRYRHDDEAGWAGNPFLMLFKDTGDRDVAYQRCGLAFYGRSHPGGAIQGTLIVPFWFIAIIALTLPTVWLYRRLKPHARIGRRGFDVFTQKPTPIPLPPG